MASPKLVVYVEDNPANLALVRKVLESTGRYRVEGADTGELGLTRIRQERPDLVLLDLDLPSMSGFEVCRALKRDPTFHGCPIVAISASVMKRERDEALAAGCTRFIEKPFDIGVLRQIVDEVVAEPRGA